MHDIWRAAFSDNTWQAYNRAWQVFKQFLRVYQFTHPKKLIQFNEQLLLQYAYWRFKSYGVKGETIRRDITGINAFLGCYGYNIKLGIGYSDNLIRFYRGCNRLYKKYDFGKKTYERRALVDTMVHRMIDQLPGDSEASLTARGLLLYSKKTAFRSHNYVRTKTGGNSTAENVHFFHHHKHGEGCIIELPHSKTHQKYDKGKETRTLYCECKKYGKRYCCVHTLKEILKNRMGTEHCHEAIFLNRNGYPVTYNQWQKLLKILCNAIGIDPKYYPSHSLRIGEATDRSMRGEPIERIMKFIGWKHRKSAMIYIRPDNPDFVKFGIKV